MMISVVIIFIVSGIMMTFRPIMGVIDDRSRLSAIEQFIIIPVDYAIIEVINIGITISFRKKYETQ